MSDLELTNDGLRIDVSSNYRKLRAAQDGLAYWDLACQEIVLEEMGAFLPRVTETGDKSGLFRKAVSGMEVCKGSRMLGLAKVPKSTIVQLNSCIDRLKGRLSDSSITPEARRVLEHFKLPDPARMPECYRSYWLPLKPGLAILWGFERNSSDSVDAKTAISRLSVEEWWKPWLRWLGWLLLALLCLVLLWMLIDLWNRWPSAHLQVTPATVRIGDNVVSDINGTTGDERRLKWDSDEQVEIVPPTTTSTHQFASDGHKQISLDVESYWLGIALPRAHASASVVVGEPPQQSVPVISVPVAPTTKKGFLLTLISKPGEYPARIQLDTDIAGTAKVAQTGESATLDGTSPSFLSTIQKPGEYTIDFTPDNGDSSFKTEKHLQMLPADYNGKGPVARLNVDKPKAQIGEAVSANTDGSFDPQHKNIVDKQISWDGGKTFESAQGPFVSHIFDTAGDKDVIAKVTDEAGLSGIDQIKINVATPKTDNATNSLAETAPGALEKLKNGNLTAPMRITLDNRVLFGSGSADLSIDGEKILKEIGKAASDQKLTIQIKGYTDDFPIIGNLKDKYKDNQALSEARAHSAAAFLSEIIGVDDKSIKADGFGDANPIAPNDTDENRAKNRRIEITLTPGGG